MELDTKYSPCRDFQATVGAQKPLARKSQRSDALNRNPTSLAFPPFTPGIKLLVVLTSVAYVLEIIWVHWIAAAVVPVVDPTAPLSLSAVLRQTHLALHPPEVFKGYIWQLVTYLFLHDPTSPWHVILNLFFLWMFGAEFELRWGKKRFIYFYFIAGGLAALFVLLWSAVLPGEWERVTLGASGAVYALLAAYGVAYGNRTLWPIPIKASTFVWVLVGLNLLYFLMRTDASVAAHLGGLLAGYLLTTGNWRPRRWLDRFKLWQLQRRKRRFSVVPSEKQSEKGNGRMLH